MRKLLNRVLWSAPLLVFFGTAGMGVWTAYNRAAAWSKFVVIGVAVLLAILLAIQPRRVVWTSVGSAVSIGAALAVYFLLTYNWDQRPVELDEVNRIGQVWMSLRPDLRLPAPDPEETAYVLTLLIPLAATLAWKNMLGAASQERSGRLPALLGWALSGSFLLVGLAMTGEWLPWLGLLAGLGLLILWQLSLVIGNKFNLTPELVSGVGISSLALLGLVVLSLNQWGTLRITREILSAGEAGSRFETWGNTLQLAEDFLLTGGGLKAFDGLYSHYILAIPFSFNHSSHNLFLDVTVEQGIFGLLALVWIWLQGFHQATAVRSDPENGRSFAGLGAALLIGFGQIAFLGFVDNAYYSGFDLVAFFFLVGLAGAAWQPPLAVVGELDERARGRQLPALAALVVMAGLGAVLIWRPLMAELYSNLGAVAMAKADLADFPAAEWEPGLDTYRLGQASPYFQRALALDPNNRTAHFRLGLAALSERDFEQAVDYLGQAHGEDPHHPGILKALGYGLAWAGQIDQAAEVLLAVPGAEDELEAYSYFWRAQDRSDLAQYALEVRDQLIQHENQQKKISFKVQ